MSTQPAVSVAPEVAGELERTVDGRAVRAVFQPLVDLSSGDAVGFEALARGPAGLLGAVARARAVGWGVALDDVGAEPAPLAVMPFVRPDVVKLGLRLVQGRTTAEVARIVNAVRAQAERTGARILAEGIETRRHAEIARTMGATIGQGYLYGRPGVLPSGSRPIRAAVDLLPEPAAADSRTPFEVVAAERPTERVPKDLLLPMSMHIEHNGLGAAEPGGSEDPLRGEWDVILVGPHFAAALVARDCGDDGPDSDRRFGFVITHDRDLVVRAAQPLLDKLAPAA
jgi:EAL domain-containing protein (putative c-di-GMP-specific phosphodiesterase class I)